MADPATLEHVAVVPYTTYQAECASCRWWSAGYVWERAAAAAGLEHEQTAHPKSDDSGTPKGGDVE